MSWTQVVSYTPGMPSYPYTILYFHVLHLWNFFSFPLNAPYCFMIRDFILLSLSSKSLGLSFIHLPFFHPFHTIYSQSHTAWWLQCKLFSPHCFMKKKSDHCLSVLPYPNYLSTHTLFLSTHTLFLSLCSLNYWPLFCTLLFLTNPLWHCAPVSTSDHNSIFSFCPFLSDLILSCPLFYILSCFQLQGGCYFKE